jgi:hypothetical protein
MIVNGKLWGMFEIATDAIKRDIPERLRVIKNRSQKQYIDDGPVALYHALYALRSKGFWTTLMAGVDEAERLYALEDARNPEYFWEGMFQDPPKKRRK